MFGYRIYFDGEKFVADESDLQMTVVVPRKLDMF